MLGEVLPHSHFGKCACIHVLQAFLCADKQGWYDFPGRVLLTLAARKMLCKCFETGKYLQNTRCGESEVGLRVCRSECRKWG